MPFTKLDSSILDSSIWDEPDATRIVFITMLAMADATGYVGASVSGLAHRARVSVENTRKALATLLGPDPGSRDGGGGERIEEVDRGWQVINHQEFRARRDPDARRERERVRKEKYRERKGQGGTERDKVGQSGTARDPSASASASVSGTTSLPQVLPEEERKASQNGESSEQEGRGGEEAAVYEALARTRIRSDSGNRRASLLALARRVVAQDISAHVLTTEAMPLARAQGGKDCDGLLAHWIQHGELQARLRGNGHVGDGADGVVNRLAKKQRFK